MITPRLCVLVALIGSSTARAHRPEPIPAPPAKSDECQANLDQAETTTDLLREATRFFRNHNETARADRAHGAETFVLTVDDAVIVRQRAGLRLVRKPDGLVGQKLSVSLSGDQILRAERIGEYFMVITSGTRPGSTVHFIHQDTKRVDFTQTLPAGRRIEETRLPMKRGVAIRVDQTLVFLYQADADSIGPSKRRTRLSIAQVQHGEIKEYTFDEVFRDLPIVKIKYEGIMAPTALNLVDMDISGKTQVRYVDYSASRQFLMAHAKDHTLVFADELFETDPRTPTRFIWDPVGTQKSLRVFINPRDARTRTHVGTVTESNLRGFFIDFSQDTPLRFDLESLEPRSAHAMYQSYAGRARLRGEVSSHQKDFELFLPTVNATHTEGLPMVQALTTEIYRNPRTKQFVLEADERDRADRDYSPSFGWRYTVVSGVNQHEIAELSTFNSTLRLFDLTQAFPVPVEATARANREHPFLFAKVAGAQTPGYLVIDTRHRGMLWMANLKRIQFVTVNRRRLALFFGERHRGDELVPLIAAYSFAEKTFEFVEVTHLSLIEDESERSFGGIRVDPLHLSHQLKHLNQPDNLLIVRRGKDGTNDADFFRGAPYGPWAKPGEASITYHPNFNVLHVDTTDAREHRNIRYQLDLESFNASIFGQVFPVTTTFGRGIKAADVLVTAAAEHTPLVLDMIDDGVPGVPPFWRESARRDGTPPALDATHVQVIRRTAHGPLEDQLARVGGHLDRLNFFRAGSTSFATGHSTYSGLIKALPAEFTWDLSLTATSIELVNKVAEPKYQDHEYRVEVSDRSSESDPRLIVYRKTETLGREISLSYQFKPDEKKTPMDEYYDVLYGRTSGEPQHNTQNIATVTREGELLFITTEAAKDQSAQTYVYDVRRNKIVIRIPNYQTHRDLGAYRFYIGQSDLISPTIVAVFNNTNHAFKTFFDFGKVNLDVGAPDLLTPKGNSVFFRTSTGSTRVFDINNNYFLGTVSPAVKEKLMPIEGSLGTVWNDAIFQAPAAKIFERDQVMNELQSTFPLRPGKFGGNHTMLVLPEGAGATSILKDFILRYITGEIKPKPHYRVIFFKLDALSMSSDATYQSQMATKFKNLREVAKSLTAMGYRLVVIMEGVHNSIPDAEVQSNSDGGELFKSMPNLMESGDFDVLATTTPAGLEQLQRRKGSFAAAFRRVLRAPPLTPVQSARAIHGFLTEEFGAAPVMSERQVQGVIERVSRLNGRKGLPGAAFDILTTVLPPTGEKGKAPTPVTDGEIDAEIARRSGVPKFFLDKAKLGANAEAMRVFLNSRVRGASHLIDQVVNDLVRFARERNRPGWPILRILALGPTGTGKSELSLALTEFLFENQDPRLKVSGENWKHPESAERLKEMIVLHIRQHPCNLLQFDEFEKMHPDLQDIVLSLNDGELADAKGQKVSTALSMVYASVNLGVAEANAEVRRVSSYFRGTPTSADVNAINANLDDTYVAAMKRDLKPEVMNRFERYLIFPFLNFDIARVIAEDYLNGSAGSTVRSLRERFARDFSLSFDESALAYVAEKYVEPEMGARRLAINIEKGIVSDFLGPAETAGDLKAGGDYVIGAHARGFLIRK